MNDMNVKFPLVVSYPAVPVQRAVSHVTTIREVILAQKAVTRRGMPIIHADTVSISDEARAAYRRMMENSLQIN